MPLQWTGELRSIVEGAERDAARMRVRMNTALLLRSMLKMEGPAQRLLAATGISLESCEAGLKTLRLGAESLNTPQRIYEKAEALGINAQKEMICSSDVLVAMLDEPCMGHSLLMALNADPNIIRGYSYRYVETESVYSRGSSHSMNAVAVQRKSPVSRPTTYIETQPAVSYGDDADFLHNEKSSVNPVISRSRLMTPNDILQLKKNASQPSLPGFAPIEQDRARTSSKTDVHRSNSSAFRSTSSREMQQATTLDLARRLKEKKSRTSEARRASREMEGIREYENSKSAQKNAENTNLNNESVEKLAHLSNDNIGVSEQGKDASESSSLFSEMRLSTQELIDAAEKAALPEVSFLSESVQDAERVDRNASSNKRAPNVVEVRSLFDAAPSSEPSREIIKTSSNPIISRRNYQAANDAKSVYTRKSSQSKLPAGFTPLSLNKARFPMLCAYGRNLLSEAAAGRIDPVIDREHEIDQLIDILNKRRCNNPILVGEAGVGKTAIIEGLALRMARSDAPRGLEDHTIIALDYGSILCGTQLRGAVQERIKAIKNEVSSANGHIILFLDEIHSWLSSSSGDPNSDAALELKMALSRGELMCIGASTPQELRRAFNADPAFERRFDFIEVKAPGPETSVRIIEQGIIGQYAAHHGVEYESDAIRQAVRLSERYIQERSLPDKAISVLDRAGSLCERSGERAVTSKHVAQVIAQIAEVPVERLLMTEKQKLMKMEEILGQRLIGHEDNIKRMSSVIRRNHAGFGAQRPIGSFLFLGPTGVGKTEAAKVLAEYLFGSSKNIVRFDMSEYMEQHSVAKLIGAPAGYVGFDDGGLLTEALRKRPYQIVLFDEIEKAHPDVMNILLQILDEGRLTDAKGRHVNFCNTVIIMTSNLGASEVMQASQNGIGFAGNESKLSPDEAENIIMKSAKSRFTPELWNRIEEKLIFHPLTIRQIERIAHLLLSDSKKRLLNDKGIDLTFSEDTLIPYLIQNGGFDPCYGARPMRKTIQSLVESKIADWILDHEDLPKELFVGMRDGQVCVDEIVPLNPLI